MDRSASAIARQIELAREGRAEALGTLLGTYRNYLRILAATCLDQDVRGKADPSDVVQDALLSAHKNFHQFRGTTEQEWIAWVRRILVNSVRELHERFSLQRRKISRERSLEALMERSSIVMRNLVPAPGPSPSQHAQQGEFSVVLADALAEMEPEDRDVVILRNLQELEWNEIGERMGRSRDAVRMLWTRAIQRLGPLLRERMS